jgi:rSAM/selenodomain-associated transferase 1
MMQKMSTKALLVFVRAPRPGQVKTRLARTLGDERAAEFYRLCTDNTLREINRLPREVERYIFFAESVNSCEMNRLTGLGFKVAVQKGKNLGERLHNAFRKVFENGARKVVIIASDVPDLSAKVMKEAIDGLDNSDVVIGPCYDGGYYLIGMKELHKELFTGISWGTDCVYRQTLDSAKSNGLIILQMPILIDVDTEADLRRWSLIDRQKKPAFVDFIKAIHL